MFNSLGTFCYTMTEGKAETVSKENCHIRKCKSADCKIAGTGNDYIGKINITRSNRTCQNWIPARTLKVTNNAVEFDETLDDTPSNKIARNVKENSYTRDVLKLLECKSFFENINVRGKSKRKDTTSTQQRDKIFEFPEKDLIRIKNETNENHLMEQVRSKFNFSCYDLRLCR